MIAMLTAASNKTTTISRSATNRASVQAPIETAQGENAVSVDNTVGSVLAEATMLAVLPEMPIHGSARSTLAAQSSAMAKLNEFTGVANGIIPG